LLSFLNYCGDDCGTTSTGANMDPEAPKVLATYDILGGPSGIRTAALLKQHLDNGQTRKVSISNQ